MRPAAAPVAVPAVPAAPPVLKTPRSSTDSSVFETKSLQETSTDRFVKSEEKNTTTPVKSVPEIPKPTPVRQKSVLLPGSPPELAYAPPRPQSYYEGRSGMPYHNAVGTELKKTVRMDESTENSRRIVTVEQTSRVIKFGENRVSSQDQQQQQFQQSQHQQRQASRFNVPKPKKFVQGQFRESDYESDADVGRIRPKWAPADSDTEDPQYRKVQPPRFPRSSSQPPPSDSGERVATPMEFDSGPPAMSCQSTSFEQHLRYLNEESERLRRSQEIMKRHDSLPEPGTPPQFGYVSTSNVKKAANRKDIHSFRWNLSFYFRGHSSIQRNYPIDSLLSLFLLLQFSSSFASLMLLFFIFLSSLRNRVIPRRSFEAHDRHDEQLQDEDGKVRDRFANGS